MPLQATSGAASYDGFGGGVPFTPTYIEDVFSTWLYPGNGSTQTITNGIDLSGKGGLVFVKCRNETYNWRAFDSARGFSNSLFPNLTSAQNAFTDGGYITATSSTGFTVGQGTHSGVVGVNASGFNYASWTFRKQPKFFDVVTWTGNGTNPRQIAHNLGSVPGCIIVKSTTRAENWTVYHRSLGNAARMALNTTDAQVTGTGVWGSTTPTSTHFTVSADNLVNFNGDGYVAYLFAHDAGGFGLTGTDNVISCGSFTTGGSYTVGEVNLGYEPQWAMIKRVDSTSDWSVADIMRGMPGGNNFNQKTLNPNLSDAEQDATVVSPNATGFSYNFLALNATYIYIAIRRGPMRTPTTGTSVFAPITYTGTGATRAITSPGFPVDFVESKTRNATYNDGWFDRLRGAARKLSAVSTGAEIVQSDSLTGFDSMTGYSLGADASGGSVNESSINYVNWAFRRAPGFFDVVCYTGNATVGRTVTHNLGVAPELLIVKNRAMADYNWKVYSAALGNTSELCLDLSNGTFTGVSTWNSTTPTSTQFTLSNTSDVNRNATNYVAYLFASCPGVSKVFSFTGNGSSQTINCGFTGGARFVMIKRTDSTGDWYVWDTARGIVANNDPHLSLNSTAAEVTTNDTIDTDSTGFVVNQVSATNVNVNGASYIGLAIA